MSPVFWIRLTSYLVFIALNSLWGGWFTVFCILGSILGIAIERDRRLGLHS